MQARATFWPKSARVDAAVLWSNLRLFAIFPVLHQLRHGLVGQILIEILVVHLDHWSVDTGTQAFDLRQSKQTICTSLVVIDIVEVLDRTDYLSSLQTNKINH